MSPGRGSREPEYEADRQALPADLQLELDLLEEQILSDPDRDYQREYGRDGAIYDFSGYDRLGLTVVYARVGDDFVFLRVSSSRGTAS